MNWKELMVRVLVAVVGIPLILTGVLWGHLVFLVIVLVIQILALSELYQLNRKKGQTPNMAAGFLLTASLTVTIYYSQYQYIFPVISLFLFWIMIQEMFRNQKDPMANMSVTMLGSLYISQFAALILIREFPMGSNIPYRTGGWLVMQIFFTIWICDTAAYLWGSRFGKHPLFKRVSPKKSWEGAVAGLVSSVPGALLVRQLFLPETSVMYAVVTGLIVGVFGQTGDLIESYIKRITGVKDSSNILPGHGGFLDRFDSPMIVAPLIYLVIHFSGIQF